MGVGVGVVVVGVAARVVAVQVGEGTVMMVVMGAGIAHISCRLTAKNYTSESVHYCQTLRSFSI